MKNLSLIFILTFLFSCSTTVYIDGVKLKNAVKDSAKFDKTKLKNFLAAGYGLPVYAYLKCAKMEKDKYLTGTVSYDLEVRKNEYNIKNMAVNLRAKQNRPTCLNNITQLTNNEADQFVKDFNKINSTNFQGFSSSPTKVKVKFLGMNADKTKNEFEIDFEKAEVSFEDL